MVLAHPTGALLVAASFAKVRARVCQLYLHAQHCMHLHITLKHNDAKVTLLFGTMTIAGAGSAGRFWKREQGGSSARRHSSSREFLWPRNNVRHRTYYRAVSGAGGSVGKPQGGAVQLTWFEDQRRFGISRRTTKKKDLRPKR